MALYSRTGNSRFSTSRSTSTLFVAKKVCLVRGVCGSLIRSNGAGTLGSRSRQTRCRMMTLLFVATWLSDQFALPGKRYAVNRELLHDRHRELPRGASGEQRHKPFGQTEKP